VANFVSKGASLPGAARQHTDPLALIELRNGINPPSYQAGTENFYTITRYNLSKLLRHGGDRAGGCGGAGNADQALRV
jgi:hypothetical protein